MNQCGDCKHFDEDDVKVLVQTFAYMCKKKNFRVGRDYTNECFEAKEK